MSKERKYHHGHKKDGMRYCKVHRRFVSKKYFKDKHKKCTQQDDCHHNFQLGSAIGIAMLFCTKCGFTKEAHIPKPKRAKKLSWKDQKKRSKKHVEIKIEKD